MRKWIIIIILFLFLIFTGLSVYAYQIIREPLEHHYEQAERYVKGQSLLTMISDVMYFHGTDAYYVFSGVDDEGIDTYVWVSADYDFHHIEKAQDGITKEEALEIVTTNEDVERIETVKLGFERGLPVYEITYVNHENRKGYYYVTFEDGTFMKRYLLRTDL
ncbi:hypothetical protein JCM9140_1009 [Halalkalibacter wakoensis JCM 9140]|uniref:Uncharacterized protein n=1 Tax=Halalkalibacter wakoensis JCM 9140 TaxID=1236970 RepID=W4Q0Z5_9BACI|nr:DUF5590 domain-containing protein [Halalkalibacter wakoensis]GAE25039.1 hypothetical protein JCM9140_1009 [Halalkalibacter wakoensis JCM 9140]